MARYELTLKNEKAGLYKTIGQLLVLLNTVGIIYQVFIVSKEFKNLWGPAFVLLMTFAYLYLAATKKFLSANLRRFIFFVSSYTWIQFGLWWLGFLLLFLIFLDILVHRKLIIIATNDFIQLPLVPKKNVQWSALNNVVIKDGIITVDFKNNKLFQHPVLESGQDINAESFNQFCSQRLATSG